MDRSAGAALVDLTGYKWRGKCWDCHRFSEELPGGGSRDGDAAGGGEAAEF